MKHRRQKSLLLGCLALLAPLPLPFNEVVGWPSVMAFLLAVIFFLQRTLERRPIVLPVWAMNLLGLVYIPFFLADLTVLRQGRVLQPLVHLVMFALAVKLLALRREADKWHAFTAVFFLFLAATGTSVHPTVFLYLVVFLALSILTLTRFAGSHTVVTHEAPGVGPRKVPLRRFVWGATVLAVVGSIPLFFFLPRLRQPYIWAPAAGAGGAVQVSGFSDRIDLEVIGRVRTSRSVLLRYAFDTPIARPPDLRLKAATYTLYDRGTWRDSRRATLGLQRNAAGYFPLGRERPESWVSIWLRARGGRRVVLPVETRAVDIAGNGLLVDDAGAVSFLFPPSGTVSYRAGLGDLANIPQLPPDRDIATLPEMDENGITPEIAELAAGVLGGGEAIERVQRLESYLRDNYEYSLDMGSEATDRPVERFLFERRAGHCEYFVSAMVLMLRSQGIPARVVTGYLGADYNRLQGYYMVRYSNAHAWVEAYLPSRGWAVFDPTPADGRPLSGTTGWTTFATEAWDSLVFRWDRYVLTYGFGDQVGVFIRFREILQSAWRLIRRESRAAEPETVKEPQPTVVSDAEPTADRVGPQAWHAIPLLLAVGLIALWMWRQRERFTAIRAYRSLRGRLLRADGGLTETAPPLEVQRLLDSRWPRAAQETGRVVELYLRESFGEQPLTDAERRELKGVWRTANRKLRKSA